LSTNSNSGIFVARLADSLRHEAKIVVVAPAGTTGNYKSEFCYAKVTPFKYAPAKWQILAHSPGGIPVALKNQPWLHLLLPSFLISMLHQCTRQARSCQVIHANWAICGCIAGLAGKLTGVPVVTTLRGEDISRAKSSILDRMILSLAIRLSSHIACVSSSMREWVCTKFQNDAKVAVVPNGVNEKFLKIGMNRLREPDRTVTRLISIGSLIPRKGFDLIINALSDLPARDKIHLTIVGSGPERERLQKLAEDTQTSDQISFIGYTAPSAIPHMLESADIFVLASHSEGRPNVILEAMATGLPVIASNIEGINELVEPNTTGLLFEDGNREQLQSCLAALADNPDQRWKFGQTAIARLAERGLHWDITADNYRRLYQQATKS